MSISNAFFKVQQTNICDESNNPIQLTGVNLGGWLLWEGYFMHAPNRGVHLFKNAFKKKHGLDQLHLLENAFYDRFIQEGDIKTIADFGVNCLRIPFHYRLIEKSPFEYDTKGMQRFIDVVNWAKNNNLKVMFDLHAACGAQNHDWHSDSDGRALLWENEEYQDRTCKLWQYVADQFKDDPTVVGYDILNEAVVGDTKKLNDFYQKLINSIREIDTNHILFVEGNNWSTDIKCLDEFSDSNLALSIHHYEPFPYVFNLEPHLHYPLTNWNKDNSYEHLEKQQKIAKEMNRPIFVGEFGINYREGIYGEDIWLDETLAIFKEFNFHWTYWTYKAVKNSMFPDGLYSYYPNSPWVNRHGPLQGWDTWADCWDTHKQEMIDSWQTSKFKPNAKVIDVIKQYGN